MATLPCSTGRITIQTGWWRNFDAGHTVRHTWPFGSFHGDHSGPAGVTLTHLSPHDNISLTRVLLAPR